MSLLNGLASPLDRLHRGERALTCLRQDKLGSSALDGTNAEAGYPRFRSTPRTPSETDDIGADKLSFPVSGDKLPAVASVNATA